MDERFYARERGAHSDWSAGRTVHAATLPGIGHDVGQIDNVLEAGTLDRAAAIVVALLLGD